MHHILRKCPDAAKRKKIQTILKEGRKARKGRTAAQASTHVSGSVSANAGSICWFCHADVSNLANNKCAGCRKVTVHIVGGFETYSPFSGTLL